MPSLHISNISNVLNSHSIQISNINMLKNCETHCHFNKGRVYYKCREDSEVIHKLLLQETAS